MHTIPANKFHRTKFKPKSSSTSSSSKKTNRWCFKPRQVPKGIYRPYELPTLYPAACPLQKFPSPGKSNISILPQPSPLKVALMAPSKLRAEMPKESVSSIIWDSGASLSITNNKTDFHGTLKQCPYKHLMAKQDFELKFKDARVIHLEYISDNGTVVTSKSYTAHLSNF